MLAPGSNRQPAVYFTSSFSETLGRGGISKLFRNPPPNYLTVALKASVVLHVHRQQFKEWRNRLPFFFIFCCLILFFFIVFRERERDCV